MEIAPSAGGIQSIGLSNFSVRTIYPINIEEATPEDSFCIRYSNSSRGILYRVNVDVTILEVPRETHGIIISYFSRKSIIPDKQG